MIMVSQFPFVQGDITLRLALTALDESIGRRHLCFFYTINWITSGDQPKFIYFIYWCIIHGHGHPKTDAVKSPLIQAYIPTYNQPTLKTVDNHKINK